MAAIELYSSDNHHNILLSDYTRKGLAVQANHHLILHGNSVLLIDPGGHKVFNKLVEAVERLQSDVKIESIVFSHQDPDIVAALNGWLMITDARAYISALWERFVPHFGIDPFLEERLLPVQDGGCWIDLDGAEIALLPAHFLHSAGNFHVYDPQSKVLYSGDLGASFGPSYRQVTDFDGHIDFMAPLSPALYGQQPQPQALAKDGASARPRSGGPTTRRALQRQSDDQALL